MSLSGGVARWEPSMVEMPSPRSLPLWSPSSTDLPCDFGQALSLHGAAHLYSEGFAQADPGSPFQLPHLVIHRAQTVCLYRVHFTQPVHKNCFLSDFLETLPPPNSVFSSPTSLNVPFSPYSWPILCPPILFLVPSLLSHPPPPSLWGHMPSCWWPDFLFDLLPSAAVGFLPFILGGLLLSR